MAADTRAAWTGTYAEGRFEEVRVEAASWEGHPVLFSVTGDWIENERLQRHGGEFINHAAMGV